MASAHSVTSRSSDAVPVRIRLALLGAATVINGAVYLAINEHPLRAPALLPRTTIDNAIGWHAWAIWPYWLLLLCAPALALAIRNRAQLLETLHAYAVAISLNVIVWLAWPTYLPRAPLPSTLDATTAASWRLLLALDADTNCFPSGHVTIPLVVAAGFTAYAPRTRGWVWPLIVALLPSVIATGQHYALDVLGGACTAAIGIHVARRGAIARQRQAASPAVA